VNGFGFDYSRDLGKFDDHSLDLLAPERHFNELANSIRILMIRWYVVIKDPLNMGDIYGDTSV
jgi:hypothetical protein